MIVIIRELGMDMDVEGKDSTMVKEGQSTSNNDVDEAPDKRKDLLILEDVRVDEPPSSPDKEKETVESEENPCEADNGEKNNAKSTAEGSY